MVAVAVVAVVLLQEEKQLVVLVVVAGIILAEAVTRGVIQRYVNSSLLLNSSSLSNLHSINITLTIDIIILL